MTQWMTYFTLIITILTLLAAISTLLLAIENEQRRRTEVVRFSDFEDTVLRNVLRSRASRQRLSRIIAPDGMTQEEIDEVRALDVSGKGVVSLRGIAVFHNLEYLNCDYSKIEELHITKCRHLRILTCRGCKSLKRLYCEENAIALLDVENCVVLEELVCHSNSLTELDLQSTTGLRKLWCWDNYLRTLDLSHCRNRVEVMCWGNVLEAINFSQNAGGMPRALKACHNYLPRNTLASIKRNSKTFSFNADIEPQYEKDLVDEEHLSKPSIGMAHHFHAIYGMDDVQVHARKRLVELDGFFGGLMRADAFLGESGCCWSPEKMITRKKGGENRTLVPRAVFPAKGIERKRFLIGLDIGKETGFIEEEGDVLPADSSVTLDLTDSMGLEWVVCQSETINKARIHRSRSLVYLILDGTSIGQLDLHGCRLLEWLSCNGLTDLKELDVRRNPCLRYIDCRKTQVEALDLSNCPVIEEVRVGPIATNGTFDLTLRGAEGLYGKWRFARGCWVRAPKQQWALRGGKLPRIIVEGRECDCPRASVRINDASLGRRAIGEGARLYERHEKRGSDCCLEAIGGY